LFLATHHVNKAYWGVEAWLHAFLTSAIDGVVSFMPQPLYPQGKETLYPLDKRLDGPQNRCGRGGEEKNCQPPPELEPPIIPALYH